MNKNKVKKKRRKFETKIKKRRKIENMQPKITYKITDFGL